MRFIKPCKGPLTSRYSSSRLDPVGQEIIRPHRGVDFGSHQDNSIRASAAGKVRLVVIVSLTSKIGFGRYIVITHSNGWETLYAHLSAVNVKQGQTVSQGQQIGVKGTTGNSTGVHLHFEMSKARWSNQYTHHVDPLLYIEDPEVKELQQSLQTLGFKVSVDGIYGELTASAVLLFQRQYKLVADGIAGRETMLAISKASSQPKPPTRPTAPQKEENVLELSQSQLDEFAKVFKNAREKGIFSSAEHERDVKAGKMTVSKATYLTGLIASAALNSGVRTK